MFFKIQGETCWRTGDKFSSTILVNVKGGRERREGD